MKTEKVTFDYDLVISAKQGNPSAINELLQKFKWIAYVKAKPYYSIGGDFDDVMQEGMIGLYNAIVSYDPTYGIPFRSFAGMCVERQIVTFIKSGNRKKHSSLNYATSLDKSINQEDAETAMLDIVEYKGAVDPLHYLVEDELIEQVKDLLVKKLTGLEFNVIWLYLNGYKFKEIPDILGIPYKSVDNAMQRIRKKSSKFKNDFLLMLDMEKEAVRI